VGKEVEVEVEVVDVLVDVAEVIVGEELEELLDVVDVEV